MKINLKKGDTILTGKWQNHKVTVKKIGKNELGQPTVNGKPMLKFRIKKLLPKSMRKDEGLEFKSFYSFCNETTSHDADLKRMFLDGETDIYFRGDVELHPSYSKRNSPPKELETRLDVKEISVDWKNPFVSAVDHSNDLTWEYIENLRSIFKDDEEVIRFIFKEILGANPELKVFKDYQFNIVTAGIIIGGVCSSMNVDDIKDFIDNKTKISNDERPFTINRNKKDDPGYAKLYNEVNDKMILRNTDDDKMMLGWFPSTKTMESIIKQIK
jgi:hypothetical protein